MRRFAIIAAAVLWLWLYWLGKHPAPEVGHYHGTLKPANECGIDTPTATVYPDPTTVMRNAKSWNI